MPVTPNRRTVVQFDGPHWEKQIGGYFFGRSADDIHRHDFIVGGQLSQTAASGNTIRLPGAWLLSPFAGQLAGLYGTGFEPAKILTYETPGNFVSVSPFRMPSDLPGMGISGLGAIPPMFRKRVGAGANWDGVLNSLTGDKTAFPSPPLTSNYIPHDRVYVSHEVDLPNQGYVLLFSVGQELLSSGSILRFFFGGATNVLPAPMTDPHSENAGNFCLSVRASGEAILYELAGPPATGNWQVRENFRWADNEHLSGFMYAIMVLPYASDQMAFSSGIVSLADGPFNISAFLVLQAALAAGGGPRLRLAYHETEPMSGHTHQEFMTGSGSIRLDLRRDIRTPFGVYRTMFPADGFVVDGAFSTPRVFPGGTVIETEWGTYGITEYGSSAQVLMKLYDGSTGIELTRNGDGEYVTNADQAHYFVRVEFTAPSGRFRSPTLTGWFVSVAGQSLFQQPVPVSGGHLRHYSITGDDLDPTHTSASMMISDPANDLPILRQRGRIHTRILDTDATKQPTDSDYVISVLFEGETARPTGVRARRRGVADDREYPSEEAHDYESINCLGMWTRIEDQLLSEERDYSGGTVADPHGILPGSDGKPLPWRVTSIIEDLLLHASPGEPLDVPVADITLGPSHLVKADDYKVLAYREIGPLIRRLLTGFLHKWVLVRDQNIPPSGRWRLIPPPFPPFTNILAEFHSADDLPSGGDRIMSRPHSYDSLAVHPSAVQSFIKANTLISRLEPPEGNEVIVIGAGAKQPSGKGNMRLTNAPLVNVRSFSYHGIPPADPSHPDFLGRNVQIVLVNAFLSTQEQVDTVAVAMFKLACFGRRWREFRSPLTLVRDTLDPLDSLMPSARRRPLRIYDQISIPEGIAIVRNCNPVVDKNDKIQWQDVECLLVGNGLEGIP